MSLCMATERLITNTIPPIFNRLHFLVLGSSLVVYNVHRIFSRPYHATRASNVKDKYRPWYFIFFAIGLVLSVIGLVGLQWKMLVGCAVLGLFAFMYSLPLLPFKNKKRLREFGWLKILVLAGVWTIVTSILPFLYLGKNVTDYPFEIVLRFVFIFTLCIVFDIRDMKKDLENNIYTLPQKVGLSNSYRLINGTLILFCALSIFQYTRYPDAERLIGALLTAVITRLIIFYLKKNPTDRAYLGLADGVMLLYAFLVTSPKF
jgi:4-hydroxybenzoate polyprenyltransferase